MKKLNIVVAIDDVHPETGWGIRGDDAEMYLSSLNKEFGVKFNLFIPTHFHKKTKLSDNLDWVSWLKSIPYFELCAHGHYHSCERDDIGEQEFLELTDYESAKERVELMLSEWHSVGIYPRGFRMPGWGCNQMSAKAVIERFPYIAAHADINRYINFSPARTFYGSHGIHETGDIPIGHNNTVFFQSHIFGEWNKNTWTQETFSNFHSIIDFLHGEFELNFVTFNQL